MMLKIRVSKRLEISGAIPSWIEDGICMIRVALSSIEAISLKFARYSIHYLINRYNGAMVVFMLGLNEVLPIGL
jgi:hypothetical protein